jgi:hypothetical protein
VRCEVAVYIDHPNLGGQHMISSSFKERIRSPEQGTNASDRPTVLASFSLRRRQDVSNGSVQIGRQGTKNLQKEQSRMNALKRDSVLHLHILKYRLEAEIEELDKVPYSATSVLCGQARN